MVDVDCTLAGKCSSPLCPLDEESLLEGVWYPDEEICRKYNCQFIKTQKKIAKRTRDNSTYYTHEMLNRNFVVTKAIAGLDPDKGRAAQLARWLKTHPALKPLSDEERKKRAEMLRKHRRFSRKKGQRLDENEG